MTETAKGTRPRLGWVVVLILAAAVLLYLLL
jgi:hypothetical protein